jgi:MoaA/NifB/PqqE/SkfB family radical SAM enzyme
MDQEKLKEYRVCVSPTVNLTEIDTGELIKYIKLAYRNFYLRLDYITKRILKIRNLTDAKRELQAFWALTMGLSRFYRK